MTQLSTSSGRPTKGSAVLSIDAELETLAAMNIEQIRARWLERRGGQAPAALSRELLARALAYELQEKHLGGLAPPLRKRLEISSARDGAPARRVKIGSVIVREYRGELHEVLVVPNGFCWRGRMFASLSSIAQDITGTSWNGPRFFGLRGAERIAPADTLASTAAAEKIGSASRAGSLRVRAAPKGRKIAG